MPDLCMDWIPSRPIPRPVNLKPPPSEPFTTPIGTAALVRLGEPVEGTRQRLITVLFDDADAATLCRQMAQFAKRVFGCSGQAELPIWYREDGRWEFDAVAQPVPTVCDSDGYESAIAAVPIGSRVRVQGHFLAFQSGCGLYPVMEAIQVMEAAANQRRRLF